MLEQLKLKNFIVMLLQYKTTRTMYVYVEKFHWHNNCVSYVEVEKQLSITYSECVSVPLVIQHAKCMHGIMLLSVTSLALPYFSTLSLNSWNAELNPICHLQALLGAHHIFHVSGLRVERKDCGIFFFFIFSTKFPEMFLILRRIQRDITINVHMYSCKVLVIFVGC